MDSWYADMAVTVFKRGHSISIGVVKIDEELFTRCVGRAFLAISLGAFHHVMHPAARPGGHILIFQHTNSHR
jgi:hypothetical protein